MNNRQSVATIDNVQFIDLQQSDVNPLMSKCVVKVFYIGQNRNGSFINKETATRMAATLRGCPIVGQYIKEKQDFGDHGDQLVINGQGVTWECLTKPYGFVAPDAKVWFQNFEDTDEFGNTVIREYLCVEGYIWTGQFEEAKRVLENHNPQSMELDNESVQGHWATDNNSGLEFFIINDAVISKLCILGEDVEPCFEGASFLPSEFAKNTFMKDLLTMVEQLKFALENANNEGGISMEDQAIIQTVEEEQAPAVEETVVETPEIPVENSLSEEDKTNETESLENQNTVEDNFEKKEEEEKKEEAPQEEKKEEEKKEDAEEEEEKPKAKHSIEELEQTLADLQVAYSLLEKENAELVAFKNQIENKQKDDLIASFYMLSDEDKQDVIANKEKFSLEQIEEKLSVICVRKKVNFTEHESEDEKPVVTTFNLNTTEADALPAWLRAVEDVRKNRNN